MTAPVTAYCGTPAIPTEVWTSWNLDPVVMAGLVGLAVTCRMRSTGTARSSGFAAVALLAVIFLSPLCTLSAALFSARVVHHVLLIAVAAPLLALAFPARHVFPLSALVVANLIVLWLWHVPGVYTWAIGSLAGYWLMQATLLGTALALWRELLRRGSDPGAGIAALLAMVAQMGLLGALIAFAPQALYPTHFYSTAVWGFSPLEDQQLAGLIMWVPAILPYLTAALMLGMSRLFPPEPAR